MGPPVEPEGERVWGGYAQCFTAHHLRVCPTLSATGKRFVPLPRSSCGLAGGKSAGLKVDSFIGARFAACITAPFSHIPSLPAFPPA